MKLRHQLGDDMGEEQSTPLRCNVLLKPLRGGYIPNRQAWVQHIMGAPPNTTLRDSPTSGDSYLEDFYFP